MHLIKRPVHVARRELTAPPQGARQQGRDRPCALPAAPGLATTMFASHDLEGDPLRFLSVSEAYLKAARTSASKSQKPHKVPSVVQVRCGSIPSPIEYDVCVCGGVLGLLIATSLQMQGFRVAIVERMKCEGRSQEWNTSREELQVLAELGLVSQSQLEDSVVSEFDPIRVGFAGGPDHLVKDVLNIGVSPKLLLMHVRQTFEDAGGAIFESTSFRSAEVFTDGVMLHLGPGGLQSGLEVGDTNRPPSATRQAGRASPAVLRCRLMLDCMGHYSSVVKQMRGGRVPDGLLMVAGTCAEGFPSELNRSADLLYSTSGVRNGLQLFWEAFPAAGGAARTTYMFAYTDLHPSRPTFEQFLDMYFQQLPGYQGVALEQLKFKRVLFGGFPCYGDGPLPPAFDRVMQVGDAAAMHSPLSFGGFGAMLRHLRRLSRGLGEALAGDHLSRAHLAWLHSYQPSLRAAWLFQRSMSAGVGQFQEHEEQGAADVAATAAVVASLARQSSGAGGGVDSAAAVPLSDTAGGVTGPSNSVVPLPAGMHHGPGAHHPHAGVGVVRRALVSVVSAVSTLEGAAGAVKPREGEGVAIGDGAGSNGSGSNAAKAGGGKTSPLALATGGEQGFAALGSGGESRIFASAGEEVMRESSSASRGGAGRSTWTEGLQSASHGNAGTLRVSSIASDSSSSSNGIVNIVEGSSSSHGNGSASVVDGSRCASADESPRAPQKGSSTGKLRSDGEAGKGQAVHTNSSGQLPNNHINDLLTTNFAVMAALGDGVMLPFLRDTLRAVPLALAMGVMGLRRPLLVARVLRHVGIVAVATWCAHFAALAAYTLLHALLAPFRPLAKGYTARRVLDALQVGAGLDGEDRPSAKKRNIATHVGQSVASERSSSKVAVEGPVLREGVAAVPAYAA